MYLVNGRPQTGHFRVDWSGPDMPGVLEKAGMDLMKNPAILVRGIDDASRIAAALNKAKMGRPLLYDELGVPKLAENPTG